MDSLTQTALTALSYRDILVEAYNQQKHSKKNFSFSIIAERVGCRSKSYPREVMTGRRKLTMEYAPKFAHVFNLKGEIKKIFLKFVELERALHHQPLHLEIERIRHQIRNKTLHTDRSLSEVFARTCWIDIYAALGSAEKGASLEEISGRSGLEIPLIEKELTSMLEKQLVTFKSDSQRYFAGPTHHFFRKADQDMVFKERYLDILERVKFSAQKSMASDSALFVCSTISLNSKLLPQFKEELNEFIDKFVQENELPDGDKNAHFLFSMI